MALIGRGRTADVFRAERCGVTLSGPAVVKRIRPEVAASPSALRRLEEEARILSRLRHPNVVRVHDFGRAHGTLYLAMEHLDGASLAQVLRALDGQGRWPHVALGAHVAHELASALAYAHAAADQWKRPLGLIHGAINPRNVTLVRSGAVKLGALGAARPKPGMRRRLAEARLTPATVGYLAPEQLRDHPVDQRADLYAVGVLLWEMLAGRPLFRGGDALETAAQVMVSVVPRLSAIRTGLPVLLEAVAMRALQRDPDARYQSAAELAGDLAEWLHRWPGGKRSLARLVTGVVARASPPPPLPLPAPAARRMAAVEPLRPRAPSAALSPATVEAASHGKTTFEHCPWCPAAFCYAELTKELMHG